MMHSLAAAIVKDADLAEDIVQEVMLDVWKRRASISFTVSAEQYLKGATIRRALKKWNQEKKLRVLTSDAIAAPEPKTDDARTELQKAKLKQCLEVLPPRTQLVFRLARMEGLTHTEVGKYLEISPKTVENQMLRAFRLLRECVKGKKGKK